MRYEFRCSRSAGAGRSCGKQIATFDPSDGPSDGFQDGAGGWLTRAGDTGYWFFVCARHGGFEFFPDEELRLLQRDLQQGHPVVGEWKATGP